MSPRQAETLQWIERLQPVTRAQIVEKMNCTPATVSQYLLALRRDGFIKPTGRNCHSTWVVAGHIIEQPSPIVQVASVWEYARRCAMEMRA